MAVYTSLSKNASRSTASDLSLGNDSKDIYLAKRSGISDAGRREDLVVPDDHRARIAHDPLMVAATGQAGAVWLGTQFGEVIGRENGDERLVKRGDDRAVEIGASANDPHVIQVVEPAQQVFAGSGADYTPDQSVFVVNGSAPIEDEEDPNGTPRIADIETAQGSIMRAPIVWSARFDDDDDESDAADVNAAGVTTTRTRKTRSRTSRIPWLQPTSTSTTTPLDFPPRPLSYDMRCGNGFGTACQSGLCCSEWSWCGVTGDQ